MLMGEEMNGTWTLQITDDFLSEDGGTLLSWSLEVCVLPTCTNVVSNTNDSGFGSLRDAIDCANPGDTITFGAAIFGQQINLTSQLAIVKNLVFLSDPGEQITVSASGITRAFSVASGVSTEMKGFSILAGTGPAGAGIFNRGNLQLTDMIITPVSGFGDNLIQNLGFVTVKGNCSFNQ